MKGLLKLVWTLVRVVVVVAVGFYGWAVIKDRKLLSRHFETHRVDFPIPFPVTAAELQEDGGAGLADGAAPTQAQLDSIAQARAVARGRHLVESRYGCIECHGKNFGGGTMIDSWPIGRLHGPNITLGAGSRTLQYTASDWDRIVRHGVKPDGTPAVMPSSDFQRMSDEELSDVVSYIRTMPPVDAEIARPTFGPVGRVLMATGKLRLAADLIPDHQAAHPVYPPAAEPTAAFGEHLAGICTGCHGSNFAGGPIAGGDPSWPPAANLTPDASGLATWSFDDFKTALTQGKRPDGTSLKEPMITMTNYGRQMSEVELQAIWAYLQSVPAVPSPK